MGADPEKILLESGETLQQYLDRRMAPEGNLYFPLPTPCNLFSVAGSTQGEPLALMARGEDLSQQGGSVAGCGIPEEATALMVQLRMGSPVDTRVRIKLWALDGPEPAEELIDSYPGQSDSTMVVVPMLGPDDADHGELQLSSSDWAVIEGQVVGYFRRSTVVNPSGGDISFFTESTLETFNDYFGFAAGGNATGD